MSYCVHCGVELADSEKFCPLCQTEVINPHCPWKDPLVRPYPPLLEQLMRRIDRRYLAALISTFLLIPVLVVLICDWLDGALSWSLYVVGAAALLEVWFILPLAAKRYHYLTFLALDAAAALLYLLAIERIGGQAWFFPLALPIGLAASLALLAAAYLFRQQLGRGLLRRCVICLAGAGVLAMVVEVTVDLYARGAFKLGWSLLVLSPCLVLAGALLLLNRKENLKEEIHKRIFY